jgi:hypothetical protein
MMSINHCKTLFNELQNNIIIFVDKDGETCGTFDFIEKHPYFYGDITKDTEIKLIKKTKRSKYYKILDINNDDYYYGEYNSEQKNNIMCKMFKIVIQNNIFGAKYNYILLIIDNPDYNPESENITQRGKYKLIIYNTYYHGVYFKYLSEIASYTSII